MVHDQVWAKAGMTKGERGGYLCIGCLEKRLGRRLTPKDFTDVRINNPLLRSKTPRLRSRLTQNHPGQTTQTAPKPAQPDA
jgi:hypothetical protein